MANGIMDTLSNIRTEGAGVPMADPNMLAAQAAPQGPMMDPAMGGDPTAEIMAMMQQGQEPQEDPMSSIEGDAAMLAETVVERAQGDPNMAMAILDTAKAMISGGGQQPQMMKGGGYMTPQNYQDGGQLGRDVSDMDVLRVMMANSQEGRALSDKDLAFTRKMLEGQEGRTMSDADLAMERTLSDLDMVKLLDDIRGQRGR
jgi:hypothetical protein